MIVSNRPIKSNIEQFLVRTTPKMTTSFDLAVGKFFLSSNTSFAVAENSHFTQLIEKLNGRMSLQLKNAARNQLNFPLKLMRNLFQQKCYQHVLNVLNIFNIRYETFVFGIHH